MTGFAVSERMKCISQTLFIRKSGQWGGSESPGQNDVAEVGGNSSVYASVLMCSPVSEYAQCNCIMCPKPNSRGNLLQLCSDMKQTLENLFSYSRVIISQHTG